MSPTSLDLLAFLKANSVFSRTQLAEYLGEVLVPGSTSPRLRNALNHLERSFGVQSLRRGIYAAPLVDGKRLDPYWVAGRSEPNAILGYGTALRWHLGFPCPQRIHLISAQLTRAWSFWDIYSVQPIQAKERLSGILQECHQKIPFQVTSRERTLVDVLDRPDLCGAREQAWAYLEELVRQAPIDLEGLITYLKEVNCKTTTSKVIYFLDSFRDLVGLQERDFLRFGSDELPFVRTPVYWDWVGNPKWEGAPSWILRPELSVRVPQTLAQEQPEPLVLESRRPEPPATWLDRDAPADFLESHLAHHFSFETYRPGQKEALVKVLNGQDALEVLPTGTGKSLIYLQSAHLLIGPILVISPLISLIHDQVMEAKKAELVAFALHADGRRESLEEVRKRLLQNSVNLLFMPPEAWNGVVPALPELKRKLALIVIDEAHVISAWGGSFRRDYLTLNSLGMHFPKVPMLALTATATPQTQKEIIEALGLQGVEPEPSSVFRPNLFLRTHKVELPEEVQARLKARRRPRKKDLRIREALFEARWECLKTYLKSQGDHRGIIYCSWRDETTELADRIRKRLKKEVEAYHGGMDNDSREEVLKRFKSESQEEVIADKEDLKPAKPLQIIVATMAFGMGINVKDVRFVVHFGMGNNLESYAQEIGRGGREKSWAECLLIWAEEDFQRHIQVIENPRKGFKDGEEPGPQQTAQTVEKQKWNLSQIQKWVRSKECRHAALDRFFGVPTTPPCRVSCEACWAPRPLRHRLKVTTHLSRFEPLTPPAVPNLVDPFLFDEMEPPPSAPWFDDN